MKQTKIRLLSIFCVISISFVLFAVPATAKYPDKNLTLIVAYGAGGGTDVTARLLAADMKKIMGQPVVVTNITGGGGWTSWGRLAHSNSDGYTIGYINIPNIFA